MRTRIVVGLAVIMLVIGVAIGSIAFPTTKSETTTNVSGSNYPITTLTIAQTQVSTVTSTCFVQNETQPAMESICVMPTLVPLNNNNATLVGVCTAVSYFAPDTTSIDETYPTTLGTSTFTSTTYAAYTTTYAFTSTSTNSNVLPSLLWTVTNCTFG